MIWEDLGGFERILEVCDDLGGSGRIWGALRGSWKIWEDLGSFEMILKDLGGFGRILGALFGSWRIWADLGQSGLEENGKVDSFLGGGVPGSSEPATACGLGFSDGDQPFLGAIFQIFLDQFVGGVDLRQ